MGSLRRVCHHALILINLVWHSGQRTLSVPLFFFYFFISFIDLKKKNLSFFRAEIVFHAHLVRTEMFTNKPRINSSIKHFAFNWTLKLVIIFGWGIILLQINSLSATADNSYLEQVVISANIIITLQK